MPYYQKKDTSYQWVDDNIVLNQWNKILRRKPVHPRDKYGCLTVQEAGPDKGKIWENGSGRVVSPKFLEQLHNQGYKFNENQSLSLHLRNDDHKETGGNQTYKINYTQLYKKHVLQADEGCDFDFLRNPTK